MNVQVWRVISFSTCTFISTGFGIMSIYLWMMIHCIISADEHTLIIQLVKCHHHQVFNTSSCVSSMRISSASDCRTWSELYQRFVCHSQTAFWCLYHWLWWPAQWWLDGLKLTTAMIVMSLCQCTHTYWDLESLSYVIRSSGSDCSLSSVTWSDIVPCQLSL